jgi:hypothetical protein
MVGWIFKSKKPWNNSTHYEKNQISTNNSRKNYKMNQHAHFTEHVGQ